jgi:hypothetical protein
LIKKEKTERKKVQQVQEKTFKKYVQEKRSRKTFKRIVQEKKKNVQEKRSRKTSECFKRALPDTKHDQSSEPLLDDRTFLNHVRRAQRNLAFTTPRQHPQRNAQSEHDEQQPIPAPRKKQKIEQHHCGKCCRERQQENRCALNKGNPM